VFVEARARFHAEISDIPIAHRAYRLAGVDCSQRLSFLIKDQARRKPGLVREMRSAFGGVHFQSLVGPGTNVMDTL
jgi:hypothetical protein